MDEIVFLQLAGSIPNWSRWASEGERKSLNFIAPAITQKASSLRVCDASSGGFIAARFLVQPSWIRDDTFRGQSSYFLSSGLIAQGSWEGMAPRSRTVAGREKGM